MSLVGLALFGAPLGAQGVRGRVLLPDSTAGVPGVLVAAVDGAGVTIGKARSDDAGQYALPLPAGTYTIRALRIGFRPTAIGPVLVTAGPPRRLDVVVTAEPVAIPPITVSTKRCAGDDGAGDGGAGGAALLELLGRVRASVARGVLSSEPERVRARVVRVDGSEDTFGRPRLVDSTGARESVTGGPLADVRLSTALEAGFVREGPSGLVFEVPSADVVLAEPFLQTHCFSLASASPDHPGWVGLSFRPADGDARIDRTDIAGTLWTEGATAETAELRALEFRYTDLTTVAVDVCDSSGRGPYPCAHMPLLGPAARGYGNVPPPGGRVEFGRLPTGEWFAARARLSVGVVAAAWSGVGGVRVGGQETRRCVAGTSCQMLHVLMPRVGSRELTVVSLVRDGVEVFRDESAVAAFERAARKRAGRHPSHLTGRVTDADGRAIAGARVELVEPARAAVTSDSGFFRIGPLPAKPVTVRIAKPGFEAVAFTLPLRADSTHRVAASLVARPSGDPR